MARVLPAGFPRSYYLIYSVSFNPKNMKKKDSESSSLALHDLTQKSIYSKLCNMGDVTQILFCMFNHKELMKGSLNLIFSYFLSQNCLNKLGNKSVGNPRVNPVPFPSCGACRWC